MNERYRPSWDEYGLALADTAAIRAACSRRQVGAAILGPTGICLGIGYNGVPSGEIHCTDGGCPRGQLSYEELPPLGSYSNCKGRHAEYNAIRNSTGDLDGATIYITREPCDSCRLHISVAGIGKAMWPGGEWTVTY